MSDTHADGRYRVGVIGCGRAGLPRAHAFDLHPACRVAALCDTDPENLDFARRAFNGLPAYGTWDEMLAAEDLDIVCAVLPVRPNADAVVAAAEAGVRAVFCEKPLTAKLADADRMVAACASRGVPLAAGVMVSSHPDYMEAIRIAAEGELGRVVRIHLYDGNGQGGCHGLNLTRKFAGKAPVESVTGFAEGDPHSDHEEPYDDAATGFGRLGGTLRFANGVLAFSHYDDVPGRGIEVVGTEGAIVNGNNTGLGLKLLRPAGDARDGWREVPGVFGDGRRPERRHDEHGWIDPGEPMRAIVEALVDALDHGTPLPVTTGDDLRHALEMALALRESARRGGAPVALPLEDRELACYPERDRWHYKKEVRGRDWYMEQMRAVKRPRP